MRRVPLLGSALLALTSLLLVADPGQASTTSIKAGADQGIEQGMIALVNGYRAQHGLAPLAANNALMRAARSHSRDMVENNYFDHTSLDGEPFSQRLIRFGYRWAERGRGDRRGERSEQPERGRRSGRDDVAQVAPAQPYPADPGATGPWHRRLVHRRQRRRGDLHVHARRRAQLARPRAAAT